MKNITTNDIGNCLANALENKKKNILFVSTNILEYKGALKWLNEQSEYRVVRFTEPQAIYENKNGILVENREYFVIDNSKLDKLNDEKSILLCSTFSEACIDNFQGYLDILKWRFYINKFPNGESSKHSVDKMALFVAFTTPYKPNDYAALDEKYYALFDEVYILD
jgi:hypothetical protein